MLGDFVNLLADLKEEEVIKLTKERLEASEDAMGILEDSRKAMEIVGKRFANGEYFLPELVYSGELLKQITELVKPHLSQVTETKRIGKVVIGTVAGDIHDIGLNIVDFMLNVNGFEVYNIGVDVPAQKFVEKMKETRAPILGLSGFLTLAFDAMKKTVEALEAAGMRDKIRVMIGGGQIDDEVKKYVKADAYGKDTMASGIPSQEMDRWRLNSEKKWADLSWEEKREERFKRWLSPSGIRFSSPQAEKAYKERVTRFIKAIKLEQPDHVPVMLPVAFFPAYYAGANLKKVMYDYEALKESWLKFMNDFSDTDSFLAPSLVFPGRVMDMIDYKLMKWPGHGLADDAETYQFVEGEYMPPEDYDALIRDPADYFLRYFLPRSVGALAALQKLSPLTAFVSIPVWYVSQFGDPNIRKAYQTLLDAGEECAKWTAIVNEISQKALEAGFPTIWGGMSGAPYDMIGDTLRGTLGIMTDMFRRPDKLHEAMERLVPIAINEAIISANVVGCPIIFMPLHKGASGFMSKKQFETFYWPTFRRVMMGLINDGLVPLPFAEGNYEPRLEIIRDMPRGSVIWHFEHMDMAKAKEVLADNACIAGNVPVSLLCTGTPNEVREYCRKLIEVCGKGGGYILAGAAAINKGDPDNLRAMIAAANEYGTYK